ITERPIACCAVIGTCAARRPGLQGVAQGIIVQHGTAEVDAVTRTLPISTVERIAGSMVARQRNTEVQHQRGLTLAPRADALGKSHRIAYPPDRAGISQLGVARVARRVAIRNAVKI